MSQLVWMCARFEWQSKKHCHISKLEIIYEWRHLPLTSLYKRERDMSIPHLPSTQIAPCQRTLYQTQIWKDFLSPREQNVLCPFWVSPNISFTEVVRFMQNFERVSGEMLKALLSANMTKLIKWNVYISNTKMVNRYRMIRSKFFWNSQQPDLPMISR